MTPHQISRDVSRETLDRLAHFSELITKWNPAINLVSRSTIDDLWHRHIEDSIQIYDLAPVGVRKWVDLGSGGGFPGLVVAIIAASEDPGMGVTLVESDLRKATFLSAAARELKIDVTVLSERIEKLNPLGADVVSARALAPLTGLLAYAKPHLHTHGVAIFPKGGKYQSELDHALENWRFSYHKTPSKTDPDAVILTIGGISRV